MNFEEPVDRIENMRTHLREHLRALTGQAQSTGIEIAGLIRMVANQYETLGDQQTKGETLSGPRWGLLMSLAAAEDNGRPSVTPTDLSRSQNVSKNTISSLLRGLEEQGLVSRELDPDDRRIFNIGLTPAGRTLIRDTAPQWVARLNQMAGQLSIEEQEQLIRLLGKLYCSLVKNSQCSEVP
jgi:DNA-binding MarR family transcriptional regulator